MEYPILGDCDDEVTVICIPEDECSGEWTPNPACIIVEVVGTCLWSGGCIPVATSSECDSLSGSWTPSPFGCA